MIQNFGFRGIITQHACVRETITDTIKIRYCIEFKKNSLKEIYRALKQPLEEFLFFIKFSKILSWTQDESL